MITLLFITWSTASGFVKTDIIPMPNMQKCEIVSEYVKERRVDFTGSFGIKGQVDVTPHDVECKEF